MSRTRTNAGYSLVELILVVIIIGIITSIAVRSLKTTHETSKVEQTKVELDQLASAIAGNPQLISGGTRIDFGYIGDNGSMPANLDALVSNPGLGTWDGPYLLDDFYPQDTSGASEFKIDAWGRPYSYTGGITITATGGSSSITRQIAATINDLLRNSVSAVVTDLNSSPPGVSFRDSVQVLLTYPNGTGSLTTRTKAPGADGFVLFDSIPIGSHLMQVVYIPNSDTLTRQVGVEPGLDPHLAVSFNGNLW